MGMDLNDSRWIQAFSCGFAPDDAVVYLDVGDHWLLKRLAYMNEQIATGKCVACVVTGEEGVGKTHTRVMHSVQSSGQNIPTILVGTSPGSWDGFDPYRDQIWKAAIENVQIGGRRGLASVIKPLMPSLRQRRVNCDVRELFLTMRGEVPEEGHDVLFALLRLASGLDSDDIVLAMPAFNWVLGLIESHAESIETMGVRTLMQDYSWYQRFFHLGCALRAFGYSGLLVQFDDFWGGGGNALGPERGEVVHKMLSLFDMCSRQLYPGIGFYIYIRAAIAEAMSHEAAFANLAERTSGLARGELSFWCTTVPTLNVCDSREFLSKIARVFARDACFAKAFSSMTVEATVDQYLERQGAAWFAPGPLMTGFVDCLESRLR